MRVVDLFVEALNLRGLGFTRVGPLATGRPAYHPAVLLKLYICGYLRRLSENLIPECAVFSFGFKERQQAQTVGLCNCCRDTEAGRKDKQDGMRFDRNRLNRVRSSRRLERESQRNVTWLPVGPCAVGGSAVLDRAP